jgi:hypothetical protein
VHKLFARQLAKATSPTGEVDLDELLKLVAAAYEQADRDRRRTDRSISLMIEELDTLNRGLEKLVEVRTATSFSRPRLSVSSSSIIREIERSVRRRSRSACS